MRIIYYVVEKELTNIDGFEETTGNKTVTVYSIENGKLEKFFDLELANYENSEECIDGYLEDNGYGDKEFKKVLL
jgi:hypothetical protein